MGKEAEKRDLLLGIYCYYPEGENHSNGQRRCTRMHARGVCLSDTCSSAPCARTCACARTRTRVETSRASRFLATAACRVLLVSRVTSRVIER